MFPEGTVVRKGWVAAQELAMTNTVGGAQIIESFLVLFFKKEHLLLHP